jgi:hypothetical protein
MAETREYVIRRATEPVQLRCCEDGWDKADRLSIDVYPWYKGGAQQDTSVGLLYDDEALYLLFVCEDKHIYSVETRPNGDVYKDSCVEFFAMPEPDKQQGYFNFEANCCGVVHLGWGPGRAGRKLSEEQVQKLLKVASSIPTPTRDETPQDDGWWLAAAIPFEAVNRLGGIRAAPRSGDVWRANFYRCGGKTDGQFACWNPIQWERPDFHRPEFFGVLRFE